MNNQEQSVTTVKNIEDESSDARSADGYVVMFKIAKQKMTGILAVPSNPPKARSLSKLTRAISSHTRLKVQLEGYETTRRQTRQTNVYEIKFAVREGMENVVQEFLEYAKQARVIMNPIISDMRNFKPSRDD